MQQIRLRGIQGPFKGRTWESETLLRVGRSESLEIVLDHSSVSRCHAEIRPTEHGWRIRDLGSTNGTCLNGNRLTPGQWPIRPRDVLQFGEVAIVVETVEDSAKPFVNVREDMKVKMATRHSWEEAIQGLVLDSNRCPRPGEQLLALLRANHYLGHVESEEKLLQSVLNDAVAVLDAQRGAIALADGNEESLKLRALATGRAQPRAMIAGNAGPASRTCFSQSLAKRCFSRGESILCHSVEDDPELAQAQSIADGAMASVLCVLLRSPRRRLGVLHLDRAPWQKPFSNEDLHLADALAASVSAGIECAYLLQKQRDLFLNTITILAQAVELRDDYTGGHTARVTSYSVLLAQELNLPSRGIEEIRIGTPLHDIGKIGIEDAILRKPGPLTPDEFEIMKLHTVKGAEILATIPDLKPILPIVRSHHERWDGQGYPDKLSGDAIPLLARIVSVADAFDAMTSDRAYRKGVAPETAFLELEKQSGKQFDPECVTAFLTIKERILQAVGCQPQMARLTREIHTLRRS